MLLCHNLAKEGATGQKRGTFCGDSYCTAGLVHLFYDGERERGGVKKVGFSHLGFSEQGKQSKVEKYTYLQCRYSVVQVYIPNTTVQKVPINTVQYR